MLVINNRFNNKHYGIPRKYYRKQNCDSNMTAATPANMYQRQKIIQKTVRVASSMYTMNVGALVSYSQPIVDASNNYYGVNWHQLSDRPVASVAKRATHPTSQSSSIPGRQSPGGTGVDVKHGSYQRYLNRKKGIAPLRRGKVVAPDTNLAFDVTAPVYGGKTMKHNIVAGYNCPIPAAGANGCDDSQIYTDPNYHAPVTTHYAYAVGMFVYAYQTENGPLEKAEVTGVAPSAAHPFNSDYDIYTIKFVDNDEVATVGANDLTIWFSCDCDIVADSSTSLMMGQLGIHCTDI